MYNSTKDKTVGTSEWNGIWLEPYRSKTKGRPKNRCSVEVINDVKKLKLRNWSQIVKERKA